METVVLILLGLSLLGVLGTLIAGLGSMANGGAFNRRWGNRLMRLRVLLQGVAVVLFVLAVLVRGG